MTDPYVQPAPQAYAPPPYNPNATTNGLAIASITLAFLGISIVAVVLGHVSVSQIKNRHEGGAPLAIIGIVVGYIGCLAWLAFWAFIIIGTLYAGAAITNYENGNY